MHAIVHDIAVLHDTMLHELAAEQSMMQFQFVGQVGLLVPEMLHVIDCMSQLLHCGGQLVVLPESGRASTCARASTTAPNTQKPCMHVRPLLQSFEEMHAS